MGRSKIDVYDALFFGMIPGDHSLLLCSDEVKHAWRAINPAIKLWATARGFIHTYPAGSRGPTEANRLFDKEDQDWRTGLD